MTWRPPGTMIPLSAAEQRLLLGIWQGHRMADLEAALGVTRHTLRARQISLMRKFGVHNRMELVRAGLLLGYLSLTEVP